MLYKPNTHLDVQGCHGMNQGVITTAFSDEGYKTDFQVLRGKDINTKGYDYRMLRFKDSVIL